MRPSGFYTLQLLPGTHHDRVAVSAPQRVPLEKSHPDHDHSRGVRLYGAASHRTEEPPNPRILIVSAYQEAMSRFALEFRLGDEAVLSGEAWKKIEKLNHFGMTGLTGWFGHWEAAKIPSGRYKLVRCECG